MVGRCSKGVASQPTTEVCPLLFDCKFSSTCSDYSQLSPHQRHQRVRCTYKSPITPRRADYHRRLTCELHNQDNNISAPARLMNDGALLRHSVQLRSNVARALLVANKTKGVEKDRSLYAFCLVLFLPCAFCVWGTTQPKRNRPAVHAQRAGITVAWLQVNF